MRKTYDPSDVVLTVHHPWATLHPTLTDWMEIGPGLRPYVAPSKAKEAATGKRLPLTVIPFKYRNTRLSRWFIRLGIIKDPWPQYRLR